MSNFDVFSNLKSYMDKADDSLKFDSMPGTPDSDIRDQSEVRDLPTERVIEVEEENLSSSQRRTRKRGAKKIDANESIDLTDFNYVPSTAKSRRKLADEIAGSIHTEVDLCAIPTPPIASKSKRGARGRPARKVSLKTALSAASASLPQLPSTEAPKPKTPSPSKQAARERNEFLVDLTGELELESYHSRAPIFSGSNPNKSKEESRMSLDFDDFLAIQIHVKLNGKIQQFKHKEDDKFFELFKLIAEQEKSSIDSIFLFNDNEKRINPDDTPSSVDHKFGTIYNCRVMQPKTGVNKDNAIKIKFQSDKWKKPITLKVSRLETFKSFIELLCKDKIDYKPEQITLKFDGDVVDPSDTPIALEFEGGEILDCRINV